MRKTGISQGVVTSKPNLASAGAMQRRPRRGARQLDPDSPDAPSPREGWAEDARRLAMQGDEVLVWLEVVVNIGDCELVWN